MCGVYDNTNVFADTIVRIETPPEAEMEEREEHAYWNAAISTTSSVQREGVYWRRVCIIRQGGTNSYSL